MTQIITIANRRGGAGKTATAHALGAGLLRRGYRVLFVDLDSQCNLTYDLGIEEAEASSLDVLAEELEASEAILHTEKGDLLPASPSLATSDISITGKRSEHRLGDALKSVARKYDYIIIDTPPALGVLTVNALTASDRVIIPAQAEIHSLQGLEQLYRTIETIRRYTNSRLKLEGVLITRYVARSIISQDMRSNFEDFTKAIGSKVFSTSIRECTAIKEAQATQTDIFSYAPRSNASKDYEAFIEEFLGG